MLSDAQSLSRLVGAAVLAVSILGAPASGGDGGTAANLYAAGNGEILRYRIVDGAPAAKPDLRIQNVGGPIAVSPIGSADAVVYGTVGSRGIAAFEDGHTSPDRTIFLPPPGPNSAWTVVGLAVDRAGYLYAAVYLQSFDRRGRPQRAVFPSAGVVVYGPSARGQARPVATIANAYVQAIALDGSGNLFVCGQDPELVGFCNRYADARERARLLSSFNGPTLGVILGVAAGDSDVHLSSQDQTHKYVFAAQAFPTSAHGTTNPLREIFASSGSVEGQVATAAGKIYIADGSFQHGGIWEFDAAANGSRAPLREVVAFASGAAGVAVGR